MCLWLLHEGYRAALMALHTNAPIALFSDGSQDFLGFGFILVGLQRWLLSHMPSIGIDAGKSTALSRFEDDRNIEPLHNTMLDGALWGFLQVRGPWQIKSS